MNDPELTQSFSEYSSTLEARVSRTERDIASLASTVKTLARTVETSHQEQREGFRQVHNKLDTLTDKQADHGKISWPLLLGGATLVLSLVGAISTFIILHTAPIKENQKEDHQVLMQRISQLPTEHETVGYYKAKVEFLEKVYFLKSELINTLESRTVENSTALDYMREWLRATDEKCSGVHTLPTPKLLDTLNTN
jgi:uncharacterized coiled-coil protein SlyX